MLRVKIRCSALLLQLRPKALQSTMNFLAPTSLQSSNFNYWSIQHKRQTTTNFFTFIFFDGNTTGTRSNYHPIQWATTIRFLPRTIKTLTSVRYTHISQTFSNRIQRNPALFFRNVLWARRRFPSRRGDLTVSLKWLSAGHCMKISEIKTHSTGVIDDRRRRGILDPLSSACGLHAPPNHRRPFYRRSVIGFIAQCSVVISVVVLIAKIACVNEEVEVGFGLESIFGWFGWGKWTWGINHLCGLSLWMIGFRWACLCCE